MWCKHCKKWHRHGAAEGHREAHCNDSASPYWKTGYNLAYAGKWRKGEIMKEKAHVGSSRMTRKVEVFDRIVVNTNDSWAVAQHLSKAYGCVRGLEQATGEDD